MLEEGRSSKVINRATKNKILWIMLGNSVYDITEFRHPGGQFLVDKCRGRDVGRFMFGGYMLEPFSKIKGHIHSKNAMAILEEFKFGEINYDNHTIIQARDSS